MATPSLNSVISIMETPEPDVFIVRCNITDIDSETYDADYVSRPDDPYGLNPLIRQWIADNPTFPIDPYEPPAPSLDDQITAAPDDLFGGPTLGEIYDGN